MPLGHAPEQVKAKMSNQIQKFETIAIFANQIKIDLKNKNKNNLLHKNETDSDVRK